MTVITRGERELSLRFEEFPARAHDKILARITKLTAELQERAEAAAPMRTGLLRSEIKSRIFSDSPTRVAGYVNVYAPGQSTKWLSNEYAKAATLEYGSDKPRRTFMKQGRIAVMIGRPRHRIIASVSKPAHIKAFEYLRGSLAPMRPEIEAELAAALAEVEST